MRIRVLRGGNSQIYIFIYKDDIQLVVTSRYKDNIFYLKKKKKPLISYYIYEDKSFEGGKFANTHYKKEANVTKIATFLEIASLKKEKQRH